MSSFYDLFWTESFWLPVGYSWNDFQSTAKVNKAQVEDLRILPALVVLVLVTRYHFEKYVARRFCRNIGIKESSSERNTIRQSQSNGVKRNAIRQPQSNDVKSLAKEETDKFEQILRLTKQKIWYWFQYKRRKTSLIDKATESCWRCVVYFALLAYGSFVLLKTHWFWDNSKWLNGYIKEHEFTTDMKWYYLFEMSLYLSLFISQFLDTKRKDFYQQFIHHLVTLILLFGSYTTSLYRFGSVIMYLHDAADAWLESAKVANYAKLQKLCDVLFAIFAVVFYATRLVYYPIWVAYGYFYYNTNTNSIFQNSMVCLCFVLLFLHFYWGFLIAKMVYKMAVTGKVEKDDRSDSETSDDEK